MAFLALNHPPATDTETGPARWYLVRQGELLTDADGVPPRGTSGAGAEVAGVGPLDSVADTEPLFIGEMDGVPCWAAGVAPDTPAPSGRDWIGLRALGATLAGEAWSAAARAVHLVDWARTSRFCGRCGTATVIGDGDRSMRCPACGLAAYPRVAPAVIVAVHRDGQLLLGRNGRFTGGMFSVLAGFVEPGETLEDTVHREIAEEVGVRLERPRYFGSQPWPFPHSLMVGFTAEWASGEIEVDGEEIVEAGWFARDHLPDLPPPISIARRLIEAWRAETA